MAENIPKTVDVDDLVWELGKNVVDRLNVEKHIKKLTAERTEVESLREKCEALQKSNDALARKNLELADALKVEREINAGLSRKVSELEKEMARRQKISGTLKKRNKNK